jgi:hypothetical protein
MDQGVWRKQVVKGFHDEQQQASRKKEFAIGVSEIDAQHQELFHASTGFGWRALLWLIFGPVTCPMWYHISKEQL